MLTAQRDHASPWPRSSGFGARETKPSHPEQRSHQAQHALRPQRRERMRAAPALQPGRLRRRLYSQSQPSEEIDQAPACIFEQHACSKRRATPQANPRIACVLTRLSPLIVTLLSATTSIQSEPTHIRDQQIIPCELTQRHRVKGIVPRPLHCPIASRLFDVAPLADADIVRKRLQAQATCRTHRPQATGDLLVCLPGCLPRSRSRSRCRARQSRSPLQSQALCQKKAIARKQQATETTCGGLTNVAIRHLIRPSMLAPAAAPQHYLHLHSYRRTFGHFGQTIKGDWLFW